MKISAGMSKAVARNSLNDIQIPGKTAPGRAASFGEILARHAEKLGDLAGAGLHRELAGLQRSIRQGQALKPAELLIYQIKAGQFGLRVELVSKLADSLVTTLRKLQSGQ